MAKKASLMKQAIQADKRIQKKNVFLTAPKKRNKYGNTRATYGDYTYDSKKEMEYAMDLDWRKKAKEVKSWGRQHRFDLRVNGLHICFYTIDFRVVLADNSVEYVEIKGFATDKWQLKWKLAQALFEEITSGETARLVLVK